MRKKQAEPSFWLQDNRYVMLTGEVWQETVFIAFSGETPEKVSEKGMVKSHLADAEEVEPWAVPLEWWRAFSRHCDTIPPNPPAKPKPKPVPQTIGEAVAAEEELLLHVAAGTDPLTAAMAVMEGTRERAFKPLRGPCMISFFGGVLVAFAFLVTVWIMWQ